MNHMELSTKIMYSFGDPYDIWLLTIILDQMFDRLW